MASIEFPIVCSFEISRVIERLEAAALESQKHLMQTVNPESGKREGRFVVFRNDFGGAKEFSAHLEALDISDIKIAETCEAALHFYRTSEIKLIVAWYDSGSKDFVKFMNTMIQQRANLLVPVLVITPSNSALSQLSELIDPLFLADSIVLPFTRAQFHKKIDTALSLGQNPEHPIQVLNALRKPWLERMAGKTQITRVEKPKELLAKLEILNNKAGHMACEIASLMLAEKKNIEALTYAELAVKCFPLSHHALITHLIAIARLEGVHSAADQAVLKISESIIADESIYFSLAEILTRWKKAPALRNLIIAWDKKKWVDQKSANKIFYYGQLLVLESEDAAARDYVSHATFHAPEYWQHSTLLAKLLLKEMDLVNAEKAILAARKMKNGINLQTESKLILIMYAQRKIRVADDALETAKIIYGPSQLLSTIEDKYVKKRVA